MESTRHPVPSALRCAATTGIASLNSCSVNPAAICLSANGGMRTQNLWEKLPESVFPRGRGFQKD